MKLAFEIAKRFLLSAKKQTIVIILGIAIGVSVQVFIGSLINGLQDSLIDSTIGSTSHITLESDEYIEEYDLLVNEISDVDNIKVVTPTLTIGGQLVNEDISENLVFRGLDFSTANDIYKFDEKLVEGRLPSSDGEITIGIELFDKLDISIDDSITFSSPVYGDYTLTVVGYFDANVLVLNNTWGVANISTVQNIIDEGNVVGNI